MNDDFTLNGNNIMWISGCLDGRIGLGEEFLASLSFYGVLRNKIVLVEFGGLHNVVLDKRLKVVGYGEAGAI